MSSNVNRQADASISVSYDGGNEYVLLGLKGRMVYETSDEFSQDLSALVQKKKKYIINVDELTKIDSTGLGVLIVFAKNVQDSGGQVAFVVAQEFLQNIFKIAKFDYVFPVASTVDQAKQALRDGYQSQINLMSY
ncbi:Anti-sigma-B factor antagonist [Sporomusa ovata DSM 2662]|uniref:STAS domain-containing protein n=1 Tax=Sporomusa ovata TaxID=2378 RepID=A0A0U1KTI9_9FIRM|nr:STAS domain-containing protein [Sporomusa ovata]EQB26650.1 anti-anti-sigma regulatory factor [Sporomusa ovata DSM 2662]CQR70742.1 hypothetical protein SpAn4DRAFT_1720 [Sporomusa ovata]